MKIIQHLFWQINIYHHLSSYSKSHIIIIIIIIIAIITSCSIMLLQVVVRSLQHESGNTELDTTSQWHNSLQHSWIINFPFCISISPWKINMVHLKITYLKREIIFQPSVLGFHVGFWVCETTRSFCHSAQVFLFSRLWRRFCWVVFGMCIFKGIRCFNGSWGLGKVQAIDANSDARSFNGFWFATSGRCKLHKSQPSSQELRRMQRDTPSTYTSATNATLESSTSLNTCEHEMKQQHKSVCHFNQHVCFTTLGFCESEG